jgi:hypothetical protein
MGKGCTTLILVFAMATVAALATARICDHFNLPMCNSWGLFHGSIIWLFPFYFFTFLLAQWLWNKGRKP